MTKEEAIKELQESLDRLRSYNIDENESRLMTALKMAISALEHTWRGKAIEMKPCEDAVLDKIRAEIIKHFEGCYLEEDMTDERKAEHKAYENVLQIIDKYTK